MVATVSSHDRNLSTYNRRTADFAGKADLFPAERELLIRIRERIHAMDVLDLGCGTGRTTYTLGALARSYVGIDFAPAMVDVCRLRFAESDRQRFLVADASDLSRFGDGSFDLVVFSHNGIDYLDIAGRGRCLDEARRVLRPDGVLFFSTHALEAFPWPDELPSPLNPVAFGRKVVWNARRRWANRGFDVASGRKTGWALLEDGGLSFGLNTVHVTREYESAELGDHGFAIEARLGLDGRLLGPDEDVDDNFIHYLCRPAPGRPAVATIHQPSAAEARP
jgi:SAM-dependent methyltransferase